MPTLGVVASPSAGKDVRRLVANAGSVGDTDKIAAIRRAVLGAIEGGVDHVLALDDTRHLVQRACNGIDGAVLELLDFPRRGGGQDSVRAAEALRKAEVGAMLVFGGDGTNRDVARGWADAPVVPLAVGTNNVFPLHIEPTLGGVAAGLVASGALELADVATRAKAVHVHFDDDSEDDLALVDVVLVSGEFIGSRAVWRVADLKSALFAIAEPASVGLSSIGAVIAPAPRASDHGIAVTLGAGGCVVRAPIAPGTYEHVPVASWSTVALGESVTFAGPGVLAFDGERDHVLGRDRVATATIARDGPWVIDPHVALDLAIANQLFTTDR